MVGTFHFERWKKKGRIAPIFSLLCDVSSSISNPWIKEAFRTFRLLPKFDYQIGDLVFYVKRDGTPFKNSTGRSRKGKITSIDGSIFHSYVLMERKITQLVSSSKQPFPIWDDPLDIKSNARITYNNAWCKIFL